MSTSDNTGLTSSIYNLICKVNKLHKHRAVFFLVLEVTSLVLDQFGGSKWVLVLVAFLLSLFGIIITVHIFITETTTTVAERQLGVLEVVFSVLQLITTLLQFILTVLHISNKFTSSVFPLAFSIVVVWFVFKKNNQEGTGLPILNVPDPIEIVLVDQVYRPSTTQLRFRSNVASSHVEKPISKWARATRGAAKLGKGLSNDKNALKPALHYWIEVIDPRHRDGHNLHMYYDIWVQSETNQPFLYWLDVGDGKAINLIKCPRTVLDRQCIKYLGPIERESFHVIIENGKLIYSQSRKLVETIEGSKWIFVLSTTRSLYVGQKKKGSFVHTSFLSGGATMAAGRFSAHQGVLEAIWPYSSQYLPTLDNFEKFISFLEDNRVDLSNVKYNPYE